VTVLAAAVAAEWTSLPTDELRTRSADLVTNTPADAVALLAWLVAQHGIDAIKVESEARRTAEAVREADRYRTLWSAAASCLHHNLKRLGRARGADERRVLAHAAGAGGPCWSGATDGWLPDAVTPDTSAQPAEVVAVEPTLFDTAPELTGQAPT